MYYYLPILSVLVIHYKRSAMAIRAVESIKRLGLANVEYILSDDGSPHLDIVKLKKHFNTLVLSSKNKGLGHNFNQGIMACRGSYLLILQEDVEYVGTKQSLLDSISALAEFDDVDFIRFYDSKMALKNENLVSLRILSCNGANVFVVNHKHHEFSGHAYSDMPHLRRNPSKASNDWMYREDCRMEGSEADYVRRFAMGNKFVAYLDLNADLVVHNGELSSHRTSQWDYKVAKVMVAILRHCGLDSKRPPLRYIRPFVIKMLPHARLTYRD